MANPNLHNLTTLIKRLEAATSRLEDLASFGSTGDPSISVSSSTALLQSSGSSIATPSSPAPGGSASSSTPSAPQPSDPPTISDFDALINNEVKKFLKLSEEIGGLVAEQSKSVEKCFLEQRRFLQMAAKTKKPDPSSNVFSDMLVWIQKEMMVANEIRESNRASPMFNHLSVVSDGIPAVAWVTYDDPPAFVNMMLEAAQFYGDKVLKEYKDKDKKHVEWVRSFRAVLVALQAYTRNHHTKSLTWNPDGMSPQDALRELKSAPAGAAAAPSAGGPPPPPPPPPPPAPATLLAQVDGPTPSNKSSTEGMSTVFAQLNNANPTAGLRKVDKSEMTHKNPSLRASSTVPSRSGSNASLRGKSPAPPSKPKPPHMKQKKPPKKELEGNKWIVENFENDHEIVISADETEINHSVLVYRCKSSTLRIQGKVNAISLNECPKLNVIADNLVSSIDVIKSPGFALQVIGRVPTIQVDQCDGGTIYLGQESLGAEVFTSKCSALNINFPEKEGERAEYVERPVPEQLRHVVKREGLESSIVEHMG